MPVRPLTFDDEAQWWAMRARLWPDLSPDELHENVYSFLRAGDQVAFVWDDGSGRLGGFVEASLRRYAEGCVTSPVGFLEAWWVAPEHRMRGIGRALAGAAEAWAAENGCVEMGSDAVLGNDLARAAHAALGFIEEERLVTFAKRLARPAGPDDPAADAVVTLRPVDGENVRDVCDLDVASPQRGFVAPNAVSLAEAYVAPRAWPRAIYAGETLVGFVMLWDDDEKESYYLWRFMIDRRYQRRGFGRRAMELTEEYVRTRAGGDRLALSYVPDPGGPEDFYRSLGYAPTGRVIEGELEMVKDLRDGAADAPA